MIATANNPATGAVRVATILLVDDDAAVRQLTQLQLETMGHTVLTAGGGAEAWRLFTQPDGAPVDLMITDVMMPGMSGMELAQQIKQQAPDLPVLFVSGYTDDVLGLQTVLAQDAFFLQKPVTRVALAAKLNAILACCSETRGRGVIDGLV